MMSMNDPREGKKPMSPAQQGELLDATHQAVRIERLEGEHRLLQSQVKGALDNFTSALNNVQLESRNVSSKIQDLQVLQQSDATNKTSIGDLKEKIVEMNDRMEEFFTQFEHRQDQKWRDHQSDRDAWRLRHEADNENTKRDAEKEIRNVRENVIRITAISAGVSFLAGAVVAGFLWNINYRFQQTDKDTTRIELAAGNNSRVLEAHAHELGEIKLYLARGGKTPEEPFITTQQKVENGKPTSKPGK